MSTRVRVYVRPVRTYHRLGPHNMARGLTGLFVGWLWLSLSLCWWALLLCWWMLAMTAVLSWKATQWLWVPVSPLVAARAAERRRSKPAAPPPEPEPAMGPPTMPEGFLAPEAVPLRTLVPPVPPKK